MRKVLSIFLRTQGTRPVLMLTALLLAAACEALGISAVLPAVAMMANAQDEAAQPILSHGPQHLLSVVGLSASIGVILAIICAGFIAKSAISFLALSYAGISAARVSVGLRHRLIRALYAADWQFYARRGSGEYAAAITSEATRAGDAYFMASQYMALAMQTLFYLVLGLFLDWRLALLSLAVGLLTTRALHFLVSRAKRAGHRQTDATMSLAVSTVELLANLKPLKSMERFHFVDQSVELGIRKLERSLAKRETSRQMLTHTSEGIAAVTISAVIYVAHVHFDVPLAAMVVSGLLMVKSVSNLAQLQKLLQQFGHSETAYSRIISLIEDAEANRELRSGRAAPDTRSDFRLDRVSFAYGGGDVLRDINLHIGSRHVTVLKGLSGSGKTTLVDLLVGLLRPRQGEVLLGGVPLTALDLSALRRKIGYVAQELTLFHTTIRQNICLGLDDVSEAELAEAVRLAGLEQFIASLPAGLDTDVGEMGTRLSGGQRQRIALARALAGKPDILILDEVTSSLDPATEAEIVTNIRSLARRYTIIVITHRDAWVRIADRLYALEDGRIAEVRQRPAIAPEQLARDIAS